MIVHEVGRENMCFLTADDDAMIINTAVDITQGRSSQEAASHGLQRTLADWYLIANAKYIIISPSSGFSKTAAWYR